jgi:tetratricopeptide (TPR) repeat protein
MKKYRNEALGFEINIPEEWPHPALLESDCLMFDHTPIERFNLVIGFQLPERLLEYTEFEFRQFAQKHGHTDLNFGRIMLAGRNHVWARYQMGSGVWTKKYMVVFSGVEYAITASCYNQQMLADRERIWDKVVSSFRLTKWAEQDVDFVKSGRFKAAGELYGQAYEEAAEGHYAEASALLNECIDENPNHVLAHKELAFILKNTGNLQDALVHRRIVKQLDPFDKVNRFNLIGILIMLKENANAVEEIEELLAMDPNNPKFVELKRLVNEQFRK